MLTGPSPRAAAGVLAYVSVTAFLGRGVLASLDTSVVATPLDWLIGDALVTHDLVVLLTFPLCAAAMYALVFRLTRSAAAACVAAEVRRSSVTGFHLCAACLTWLLAPGSLASTVRGRYGIQDGWRSGSRSRRPAHGSSG